MRTLALIEREFLCFNMTDLPFFFSLPVFSKLPLDWLLGRSRIGEAISDTDVFVMSEKHPTPESTQSEKTISASSLKC